MLLSNLLRSRRMKKKRRRSWWRRKQERPPTIDVSLRGRVVAALQAGHSQDNPASFGSDAVCSG